MRDKYDTIEIYEQNHRSGSFPLNWPFELSLGWRYTRQNKKAGGKNGFISFISVMSVASIAVGVMALIVVLSVMNGFQKDVRDRMLSVIPHIEVISYEGALDNWQEPAQAIRKHPSVVGVAPYVSMQSLLSTGSQLRGVMIRGIDPSSERLVSDIAQQMLLGQLGDLKAKDYGIILGTDLARLMRVSVGSKINVMVPQGRATPAGMVPRMRTFTVKGLFSSGHYEYDSSMAFVHLSDAQTMMRQSGPSGLRVKVDDMHRAPAIAYELLAELPASFAVTDWSKQNRTWFAAVQVEKRMMGLILFLIVLVGAFGLVSSMVMTVTEKQSDIAILRTLGVSPGSVMAIFMIQGAIVGVAGVAAGVVLGLGLACNLDVIVPAIESALGVQFLPKEIYFISSLPSDPRISDIVPICLVSLILSLLATVYPSWRASKIKPAEALRYE